MSDERSTFETTRARLEDIVVQARRKDVSLEQSLDLLEEAVRLVNQCNELIDQTSFKAPVVEAEGAPVSDDGVGVDVALVTTTVDPDGDGDDVSTGVAIAGQDDSWGAVDAWTEGDGSVPEEIDDARE